MVSQIDAIAAAEDTFEYNQQQIDEQNAYLLSCVLRITCFVYILGTLPGSLGSQMNDP